MSRKLLRIPVLLLADWGRLLLEQQKKRSHPQSAERVCWNQFIDLVMTTSSHAFALKVWSAWEITSIQYAHERSKELVDKACAKFNQEFAYLPESRAKEIFLHLIHFVIEREY